MAKQESCRDLDVTWDEIVAKRRLNKITHCVCRSQEAFDVIQELKSQSFGKRDDEDFLGKPMHSSSSVFEISLEQFEILLELESSNFKKAVTNMIREMAIMAKSGSVHPALSIRRIEKDDICYDDQLGETQYGCFAKHKISAGTVLGQYVGAIKWEPDGPTVDSDTAGESKIESAYTFVLHRVEGKGELFLDSKIDANETTFINDSYTDKTMNNSFYVSPWLNGMPVVFCVAKRDIDADEQILASYGKEYWEKREIHKRRRQESAEYLQILRPRKRPSQGFYEEPGSKQKLNQIPNKMDFIRCWKYKDDYYGTSFDFSLDTFLSTEPSSFPPIHYELNGSPGPSTSKLTAPSQWERDTLRCAKKPRRTNEASPSNASSRATVGSSTVGAAKSSISKPHDQAEDCHIEKVLSDSEDDESYKSSFNDILNDISKKSWMMSDQDQCSLILSRALDALGSLFSQRLSEPDSGTTLQQLLQHLNTTVEKIKAQPSFSIVLLGRSGVGKSHLANLLLLLTQVARERYGHQSAEVLSSQPELRNLRRRDLDLEILRKRIADLEGFVDFASTGGNHTIDDICGQLMGKAPTSHLLVHSFREPAAEQRQAEKAELRGLIDVCLNGSPPGNFQYVLPSEHVSDSTTAHIIRLRYGREFHAFVRFQSEDVLREEQLEHWTSDTSAATEVDKHTANMMAKKLGLFHSEEGEPLCEWPGEELFAACGLDPEVEKMAGKVIMILGEGVDMDCDRMHVRAELQDALSRRANVHIVEECVVYCPSDILRYGIELVDTPGTADLDSFKWAAMSKAIQLADGLLVVLDKGLKTFVDVVEALEHENVLKEILLGNGRPVAFIHTCAQKFNLFPSSTLLHVSQGAVARKALKECFEVTESCLRELLAKVYQDQNIVAKEIRERLGSQGTAVDAAIKAIEARNISCLPVSWGSMLMQGTKPAPPLNDVANEMLKMSNGESLLRAVLEMAGNPLQSIIEALSKRLNELLQGQPKATHAGSLLPEDLVAEAKAITTKMKRGKLEASLHQCFINKVDGTVYKPLQNRCKADPQTQLGSALSEFVKESLKYVDARRIMNRLRQVLKTLEPGQVKRAFQRSFCGSYKPFPLLKELFQCFSGPEHIGSHTQKMTAVMEDIFRNTRGDLVSLTIEEVEDLLGRMERTGRSARGGVTQSAGEAMVCSDTMVILKEAIRCYLEAGAGDKFLRAHFKACFGNCTSSRSAFGPNGLQKFLYAAQRQSLDEHLLKTASSKNKTADFEKHLDDNLALVYKNIEEIFKAMIHRELETCSRKFYQRLIAHRHRKGAPITVVYLLQNCLNTLRCTQSPPQQDTRERSRVHEVVEALRQHLLEMCGDPCPRMIQKIQQRFDARAALMEIE